MTTWHRALVAALLGSAPSAGCVFLGLAPVPCGDSSQCPAAVPVCGAKHVCSADGAADAGPSGPAPIVADSFDAPNAVDWNEPWTCNTVESSNALVSDGEGRIVVTRAGRTDCAVTAAHDVDLRVDVTMPEPAPFGFTRGVVITARRNTYPAPNTVVDDFAFAMVDEPGASTELQDVFFGALPQLGYGVGDPIDRIDGGTDLTVLHGETPATDLTGVLHVRVRVEGDGPTKYAAKVWKTEQEPATWLLDNEYVADDAFRDADVVALGLATLDDDAVGLSARLDNFVAYHAADVAKDEPLP